MSLRYKGAVISATPPTTTGGNSGTAPGAWTLQQQLQAQAAGNWPNQPVYYIEDVFSTYLYTGVGGAQTVSTGIDLATYGGLLWNKNRTNAISNVLTDTVRGANAQLVSNTTAAQGNYGVGLSFLTNGFSLSSVDSAFNTNGANYASWTFRKQPKFFDVVTFTSNSTGGATINHSLGSAPGCVIVKSTASVGNWFVYHRSIDPAEYLYLNTTDASIYGGRTVTTSGTQVTYPSGYFANSTAYVAYLFANDAGGFGLTGTDNVISCGNYTGNGSTTGPVITLGYEPQWVLIKNASASADWVITDNMRGWTVAGQVDGQLFPNSSGAETSVSRLYPTATGFGIDSTSLNYNTNGSTYIYIAIRRGPMKTPTSGTSVFSPIAYAGDSTTYTSVRNLTTNFAGDMVWIDSRNVAGQSTQSFDKLRGSGVVLYTAYTYAEEQFNSPSNYPGESVTFNNTQTVLTGSLTGQGLYNYSGYNYVAWNFRRAPGFFDEVCYTGTGSVRTINHNLGVAPEMMIVKVRGANSGSWRVYHSALGPTKLATLNLTNAAATLSTIWNDTAPTASVFTVGTYGEVNLSGDTFVAHLFASCPGVSKVGSYTGTGATQTIDCGFSGGARWVLIKRTDSTGDWYVWDTARGMVSGTDPSLLLNSTAAEVNANSVYTTSVGFQIVSTAAGINASGGSYIYLAIA